MAEGWCPSFSCALLLLLLGGSQRGEGGGDDFALDGVRIDLRAGEGGHIHDILIGIVGRCGSSGSVYAGEGR